MIGTFFCRPCNNDFFFGCVLNAIFSWSEQRVPTPNGACTLHEPRAGVATALAQSILQDFLLLQQQNERTENTAQIQGGHEQASEILHVLNQEQYDRVVAKRKFLQKCTIDQLLQEADKDMANKMKHPLLGMKDEIAVRLHYINSFVRRFRHFDYGSKEMWEMIMSIVLHVHGREYEKELGIIKNFIQYNANIFKKSMLAHTSYMKEDIYNVTNQIVANMKDVKAES